MPSAAALRLDIEHCLERRFPAALTPAPRTIREVAATGIAEVDALLDGGLPVGAISELTGPIVGPDEPGAGFCCAADRGGPGLRLGGCGRRLRSGIGSGKRRGLAAAALGAVPGCSAQACARGKSVARESRTLDAARPGIARHRSAAAGGRICGHRARPGRYGAASMATAFRWQRGSAFGRRRTARGAAWWCWARRPMRSRAPRWCWSARRCDAVDCWRDRAARFHVCRCGAARQRFAPLP